jgi:perosamine synthetase
VALSKPHLGGNEWTYVKACLDSGWVSGAGVFVERFEREVAAYAGAGHAVAVVNGTAGLHVALRVVGVEPGDEVLVPTLTFIAPVNAIRYCGAHPVLVDADPASWQMDAARVEGFLAEACELRDGACYNRRTGRRVRAMLPVHLLGLACEMERLTALARRYHLRVVEDAAEAMGARHRGRHVGTFGDIGVFSFNGNKIMTTGGGGMVVTDHEPYARSARYLTTQAKDDPEEFIHREVGYNYRLSGIQAALGAAQLEQLNRFIEKKRSIARAYEALLRGVASLTLMPSPPQTQATYWLYTVLLGGAATFEDARRVIRALRGRGIEARSLWRPMHQLDPYRTCERVGTAQAEALYARAISLPSSVGMSGDDVERCGLALRKALAAR